MQSSCIKAWMAEEACGEDEDGGKKFNDGNPRPFIDI
jgi:hypothetical protein